MTLARPFLCCLVGFVLIGSAPELRADMYGSRVSFLLDGADLSVDGGRIMLYLSPFNSDTWRESTINRLLANGDTHIYLTTRNDSSAVGPVIPTYENFETRMTDWATRLDYLISKGLTPILSMTPEQSGNTAITSQTIAEHLAHYENMVDRFDDTVDGYFIGIEADEWATAAEVNQLVSGLKELTTKPVGVHLTPGVGGAGADTSYYDGVDFIFLQTGFDLTESEVAEMVVEALELGIPVIAAEYHKSSDTSEARLLGDAACRAGASGTGNGRNVYTCGQDSSDDIDDDSSDSALDDLKSNAATAVGVTAVVLYVARLTNAVASVDLNNNQMLLGLDWQIKDRWRAAVAYGTTDIEKSLESGLAWFNLEYQTSPGQTLGFEMAGGVDALDQSRVSLSYKIRF